MKLTKLFFIASTLFVSSLGFAAGGTDVGLFFGVKNSDFKSDATGAADYNAQAGLMGGMIAMGEMGGLLFRTGGYYTERKTEVKAGTAKADFKISYIDVPVTLLYKFNDMLGLFGGATLALKMSDDCSGNSGICDGASDELNSLHAAATVGLNAKFHPNWSGEAFYEMGLNDVAKDTAVNSISLAAIFIY